MIKQTQRLIRFFWQGTISRATAKKLLEDLEDDREELQQRLARAFDESEEELLTPEQSRLLLTNIIKQAGIRPKVRNIHRYRWVAAVAVCVLTVTLGTLYYTQHSLSEVKFAAADSLPKDDFMEIVSGQDSLIHTLRDGSLVTLSPHSTVRYNRAFSHNNRDIQLIGAAKFAVKRNTRLAFRVQANGYTTTALGTEFIVDSKVIGNTHVHLLSGKVMISSTADAAMVIRDTYLAAGERLHIDLGLRTVVLHPAKPTIAVDGLPAEAQGKVGAKPKRQGLRFDKVQLVDVVQHIAEHFDTSISLDPGVAHTLTFTGEFVAEDGLDMVLYTLCLVNDLEYSRGSGGHVLLRQKTAQTPQSIDSIGQDTTTLKIK